MSSGPTRPPRSTKVNRDSSGLLISVIRALSSSQDNEDRDREKVRLEKEFKRSDQRLDVLIDSHKDALIRAMQDFNKISTRVTSCRDKVKQVKQKLLTSKILLQCKREELRKLWLESVEHNHVLQLLEQIESLNTVPDNLDKNIAVGKYLRATKDLVQSVALLEGNLSGVDALKEVKENLIQKKDQMHETLIGQLHKNIYETVTTDSLQNFRRQGSNRFGDKPVGKKVASAIVSSASHNTKVAPNTDESELLKLEDSDALDSEQQICILVRCLALLDKIPESVELIREKCQGELFCIVAKTTGFLLETYSPNVGPSLLLEFLDLLFAQFRCISARHELVLSHMSAHVDSSAVDEEGKPVSILYSMADINSKTQHVLTYLLKCYLGDNTAVRQEAPAFGTTSTDVTDVNAFFTRRRPFGNAANPVKQRKFTLFKFDNSQLAISKSSYLQEQLLKDKTDSGFLGDPDKLVCPADAKNITHMFKPMVQFVEEMEENGEGGTSPLNSVLGDCVEMFLALVNAELVAVNENAAKSLQAWKVVTDSETLKSLKVSRPILQSCVTIGHSFQLLKEHAHALPLYASAFISYACTMAVQYLEMAERAYRLIVQPTEERRTISSNWAKDEDISRFLMSLPNWLNLISDLPLEEVEESPEDVRLRNKRESEILLSNLGVMIPQREILSNDFHLKLLGHLHESLEWLSSRLAEIVDSLKSKEHSSEDNNLGERLQELQRQSLKFQDMSNMCLLVLHLEVRVHCFFYLLPLLAEGHFTTSGTTSDGQDVDRQVLEFTHDLTRTDDALSTALHQRKHKYVFEGLGQLVACILINAVPQIQRINDTGVKRICRDIYAIQQKLTSITAGREVALDLARDYFELLLVAPSDVLNSILENGPRHQFLDYKNLIELWCRSHGEEKEKVNGYTKRLQDILSEVHVHI